MDLRRSMTWWDGVKILALPVTGVRKHIKTRELKPVRARIYGMPDALHHGIHGLFREPEDDVRDDVYPALLKFAYGFIIYGCPVPSAEGFGDFIIRGLKPELNI